MNSGFFLKKTLSSKSPNKQKNLNTIMFDHSIFSYTNPKPINRPRAFLDCLIILLFFILIYGLSLGSYPIYSPDEARYSEIAFEMLHTHQWLIPHLNGILFIDKPPLFYWLQSISLSIFGIHPWSLRVLPLICQVILTISCYLSAYFLGNRRCAILAAVIMGTSIMGFVMSHVPNMDILVAMLISVSLLLALTLIHTHKAKISKKIYGCYILVALAVLAKGAIGLVLPALVFGGYILLSGQWHLLKKIRLFTGLCLVAIIVAPWFILMQHVDHDFMYFFFYVQQIERYVSHHFNAQNPFYTYPLSLFIGLIPFNVLALHSLLKSISTCLHPQRLRVPIFLAWWAIGITLFFSIPASKTLGYILPALPPLVILTALDWGNNCLNITKAQRASIIGQALVILSIGSAIFIIPHIKYIHLPITTAMMKYLIILAIVLLAGGMLTFIFSFKKTATASITALSVTAMSICLGIGFAISQPSVASAIIPNTVSVAKIINTYQQPGDTIASYHNYFYDLPLLMKRHITIVTHLPLPKVTEQDNWAGQFQAGLQWQHNQKIIINDSAFHALWHSKQRVWAVVNHKQWSEFKTFIGYPIHIISQEQSNYLVTNFQLKRPQ